MQYSLPTNAYGNSSISGALHVNGTARVQRVSIEDNRFLHDLLLAWEETGNVPVLINTSLNHDGEPIVERPHEAVRLFLETSLDALVIDEFLLTKHTRP
jgi:predicted NodU family carbamoyl transferase